MKKVRGEVNPADLFTKHLSSADRIADFCRLFRCRFATGRAAGAPSLKRTGLDEKLLAVDMVHAAAGPLLEQDGFLYPLGDYEGEAVPEAYLHDASQLPHLIGGDLRLLFPSAVPAAELEEVAEKADWLEQRATASRFLEQASPPAASAPCQQERTDEAPTGTPSEAGGCRSTPGSSSGGRRSRRTRATAESLQVDIDAANALIAKEDLIAADRSAAAALIMRSTWFPRKASLSSMASLRGKMWSDC